MCGEFYCTIYSKETYRILVKTCSNHALSEITCIDWFKRFKNKEFDFEGKERSGILSRVNICFNHRKRKSFKNISWPSLKSGYTTINLSVEDRWVMLGLASTLATKPNIHGSELLLCIWLDQVGVVYQELLEPTKIITGDYYQPHLMRLNRALKGKWLLYV